MESYRFRPSNPLISLRTSSEVAVVTDLCRHVFCLYAHVTSWLSLRLNARSRDSALPRGRAYRGNSLSPSFSRSLSLFRRTKTRGSERTKASDVLARERRKPRTPGPPNNSRATRDVYVSRRRDARVRLAATGTARERERELISSFGQTRRTAECLNEEK